MEPQNSRITRFFRLLQPLKLGSTPHTQVHALFVLLPYSRRVRLAMLALTQDGIVATTVLSLRCSTLVLCFGVFFGKIC